MDMVKKPNRMENKKIFVVTLCILKLLCVTSCSNKQHSNKEDTLINIKNINLFRNKTVFIPDTTINNKLMLENYQSAREFYSAIDKIDLVNLIRESPVVIFCNKDQTEYLLAYQYEGDMKNAFSCFEIGYFNEKEFSSGFSITNEPYFMTENNIQLGMPVDKLISIKGNNYTSKKDSTILYQIENYSSSAYLQRYNMPAYFLECTIKNSKINKIKFGFVQP